MHKRRIVIRLPPNSWLSYQKCRLANRRTTEWSPIARLHAFKNQLQIVYWSVFIERTLTSFSKRSQFTLIWNKWLRWWHSQRNPSRRIRSDQIHFYLVITNLLTGLGKYIDSTPTVYWCDCFLAVTVIQLLTNISALISCPNLREEAYVTQYWSDSRETFVA